MTELVSRLKALPVHVDYAGQAKSELLFKYTIGLFGGVGLVWGWLVQQFSQSVTVLGAGVLLAALLCIPPWPMYRRKALNWQPSRGTQISQTKRHR